MDTKNSYTEKLEAAVAKKKEELTAYEPYAPDEMFRFRGKDLFSVEDFWQYAYSQLDGMAETIAEFLVAKALVRISDASGKPGLRYRGAVRSPD